MQAAQTESTRRRHCLFPSVVFPVSRKTGLEVDIGRLRTELELELEGRKVATLFSVVHNGAYNARRWTEPIPD